MKNPIVSRKDWEAKRLLLQKKEKEFTRLRDELSKERRELPWVKIDKDYTFISENGNLSFADLFGKNSQLVIYHFMFGPDAETGCKICSFWADGYNSLDKHLNARDTTFITVSRGPIERLEAFKKNMGWNFRWLSSLGSDFNFDFQVSAKPDSNNSYNYRDMSVNSHKEMPGMSVFYKDEEGNIYHTYSCYARELETFNTAYRLLDIVPEGRNEDQLPFSMGWVKYHHKY